MRGPALTHQNGFSAEFPTMPTGFGFEIGVDEGIIYEMRKKMTMKHREMEEGEMEEERKKKKPPRLFGCFL